MSARREKNIVARNAAIVSVSTSPEQERGKTQCDDKTRPACVLAEEDSAGSSAQISGAKAERELNPANGEHEFRAEKPHERSRREQLTRGSQGRWV